MLSFNQLEAIGFKLYQRFEDEEICYVNYQVEKDDSYFSVLTTLDENGKPTEQTFMLNDRELKKPFTPNALQVILYHLFDQ